MTIRETFESYRKGDLGELEIRHFVKDVTDGHEPQKLKMLKEELHSFMFETRIQIDGDPKKIFAACYSEYAIENLKNDKVDLKELCEKIFKSEFSDEKITDELEILFDWLSRGKKLSQGQENYNRLQIIGLMNVKRKYGEKTFYAIIGLKYLEKLESIIDELLENQTEIKPQIDLSPSLEKLVDELEDDPNRRMGKKEISYVVHFADQKKNIDNISELARQIQRSEGCPPGLIDEEGSKKQTKRIKNVIKRYDKYSGNTRNYNRPSHLD